MIIGNFPLRNTSSLPSSEFRSRLPTLALFLATHLTALLCTQPSGGAEPQPVSADIVVYGGTAGGVAAAVQGTRLGKKTILIEPSRHIGGMTSGGLGATDIGNKQAIGGIAREFYRRLGKYYADDSAWKQQARAAYKGGLQQSGKVEMWTFEPRVAETILNQMLKEAGVLVFQEKRLRLKLGVNKTNERIDSIITEDGTAFTAKMFIDATYEGDLIAGAGVSYTIGREANSEFGETLNGVQTAQATKHQFLKPVDPFIKPGDRASGLLPGLHAGEPGAEGSSDRRIQAYNFRMCLTDAPENRIPFPKPEGYDPQRYELLLRYIHAGVFDAFCSNLPMPNRKSDCNNCGAFSTDNIGMNYDYPEGDYTVREKIFREHVVYQQGLMWFLANDQRVPAQIRETISRWGLCRDEFVETGGWPHQLYIREARRMRGVYVMTQHNCQGKTTVDDPIGLAAYTMDSHNVQRYVKDGQAINEGDVQVGGFPPYPISYRAVIPREAECVNLLAPVCLSATHIAYGSIRMEPVFMVLGQSSATAAAIAIDDEQSVQKISYSRLKARLQNDRQVLGWIVPPPRGRDPKKLAGVVLDDPAAKLTGDWTVSNSIDGFVGDGYRHDGNQAKGKKTATFEFRLANPGRYDVHIFYTADPNRATNVPVTIEARGQSSTMRLNQREKPGKEGFRSLGEFEFGENAVIRISTEETDGFVIFDAVQLAPSK